MPSSCSTDPRPRPSTGNSAESIFAILVFIIASARFTVQDLDSSFKIYLESRNHEVISIFVNGRRAVFEKSSTGYQHQPFQGYAEDDADNFPIQQQVLVLSQGPGEVADSQVVQFFRQSDKDFSIEEGLPALGGSITSTDVSVGVAHLSPSVIDIHYLAVEDTGQSSCYKRSKLPSLAIRCDLMGVSHKAHSC